MQFKNHKHRSPVSTLSVIQVYQLKISPGNLGMPRNFDWEGPKTEKLCDFILEKIFGGEIVMTSLKLRHNWFFKIQFRHN